MRQLLQRIDNGATEVRDVPAPVCGPNEVVIANEASLVSAGTEKMIVDLSKKSLLGKARERPDHVRRVFEKLRTEGLRETLEQVRAKLADPMTLGYSSAGVVVEVGRDVRRFRVGDRVASNGAHAEIVAVSENLVARVPDRVPFEEACYAVVGAIALQGVRLANVGVGDRVAVIGLGLIGHIAVMLLRSAGCRVVLAGDVRQHGAVERGEGLWLLEEHSGLKPAQVNVIQRQTKGPYREAVEALSKGDVDTGFAKLEAMGAIIERDSDDRYKLLAHDYAEALTKGQSVLALAPSHSEGKKVTEAIRAELKAQGIEAIAGNAADPEIIAAANLAAARCLLVAIPDAFEGGQVVEQARALNPKLSIIARAHSEAEVLHLKKHGASVVILSEHEMARAMVALVSTAEA
mgnify:CR=1 FL=1